VRRFHPLQAVRSSGWRSRAVAGALVACLVTGAADIRPAAAHGDGPHYVLLSGFVVLNPLKGGPESGRKQCELPFSARSVLRRSGPTSERFDIKKYCETDNHELYAALVITFTLQSDKKVLSEGFIRLKESKRGWLVFWSGYEEVGTKQFRGSINEDRVQDYNATIREATFKFKVTVDGPDAPKMLP
jgi:hypothetical protein